MRKISINDFSGGIQEATVSDDFSPRQWAQLKGFIPTRENTFETQWPILIASPIPSPQAIYPLASSVGTFIVGITTAGELYWAKAPDPDGLTIPFATKISTSSSYDWSASNPQPLATIQSNQDYKFICPVSVEIQKYAALPKTGSEAKTIDDQDNTNFSMGSVPGVLIHSTTVNGSADNATQQAIIAFVDTSGSGSVKAITFPNARRIPTHGDGGDFINARVLNNSNQEVVVSVTSAGYPMASSPSVRHHPYTYVDKNGALLPGRGIIPRANVGCVKGNLLLLGDIEWRSTRASAAAPLDSVPLLQIDGTPHFGTTTKTARWPNGVRVTARVIYNAGPGIVYIKGNFSNPLGVAAQVTNKQFVSGTATITTDTAHNYLAGDKVEVSIGDPLYDGIFDIVATPTTTTFTYTRGTTNDASTAVTEPTARAFSYQYRIDVGQYQELPNQWTTYRIAASVDQTKVSVARQFNLATHFLNDQTTGPYRGGIYFAAGELDSFDPRAVLVLGQGNAPIRGMHVLGDTVIAITEGGAEGSGVYRIRGSFSRLISYSGRSDPTAVKIELIKNGLGAAPRTTSTHKNFSCVWPDAGVVVFIDRLGGVWYTNGQECDRLDRYGPLAPAAATENDHVAALGRHLFVWRNNRLLVFTLMDSGQGQASGCWTEISINGTVSSMVAGPDDLYMILSGNVVRLAPRGPVAQRGFQNGNPLDLTVSTPTLGDVSSHKRTVWHRFGMTFSTPTSCIVDSVRIQSTGALNIGTSINDNAVFPDVQYRITTPKAYINKGVLGEFIIPAGIGPQAEASATVVFRGYVQLQSASFWVTGQDTRSGDK
jgi:hypothetical protein